MINEPLLLRGLNTRIPIISPIKGRGVINQGSGLASTYNWRLIIEITYISPVTGAISGLRSPAMSSCKVP